MAVAADELTVPICQPEQPKEPFHPLLTFESAWHPVEIGDVVEELTTGEVRVDERLLVKVSQHRLRAQRVGENVDPLDQRSSRGGGEQAAEHAQGGGFTRAVRAQKPEDLYP